MKRIIHCSVSLAAAALWGAGAYAQTPPQAAEAAPQANVMAQASGLAPVLTADDIIEKHLAVMGGRAAFAKLESRVSTGSIVVSAQEMELTGTVEIYNKSPNKARSLVRLDLSQVGGTEMVIDQRCDGKTAFAQNSLQGDREITGTRLQNMLNARFPTLLLTYKDAGASVALDGKVKVGMRDAYVVQYKPKTGPASRLHFDAETYLLLRSVSKIDSPELGGEVEQTSDLSDYREVDGVKIPFTVQNTNPAQTVTIRLEKVQHNTPIDDATFARPAAK